MTEALRDGDHYTAVGRMDPRIHEAHPPRTSGSTRASGQLLPHADVRWQSAPVDGPGQVAARPVAPVAGTAQEVPVSAAVGLPDAPTTRAKVPRVGKGRPCTPRMADFWEVLMATRDAQDRCQHPSQQ